MNETSGIDQDARAVEGYLERGEEAAARGSWAEARAFFEKARDLDPQGWKPVQALGVASFWLGHREDAWGLLVEALRRAPKDAENAANLLDVARSLGREDEARQLLSSLSADAGSPTRESPAETSCVKGEELLQAELWSEAVHPFLEAIDRDAERSRGWSGLGISCFRSGLKNAGVVFFEMALRLDPTDEDAILNWVESCGKSPEAAAMVLKDAGVADERIRKVLEALS